MGTPFAGELTISEWAQSTKIKIARLAKAILQIAQVTQDTSSLLNLCII